MNKTRILTVAIVTLAVAGWLLTGILAEPPSDPLISLAQAKELRDNAPSDGRSVLVRAKRSTASEQDQTIVLRGRIIDRNQAIVPARTGGQIVARHVEIGDWVEEGDVLCEVDLADRQARVDVAKDALDLADKEYESSRTLTERNLLQELDSGRKKLMRSTSAQELLAAEIELNNTKVRAPIAGVVDDVHVNVGEYIDVGLPCATILVLDPLYAQGFVSEEHIAQLSLDSDATVTLPGGESRSGQLTFISKRADEQSKTFRVEVTLANDDYSMSSGMSATIELTIATRNAHKVPTSAIVLDSSGAMGVKIIDGDSRVEFQAIEIVREDADGVWVSGLPNAATIITVGQGLVVEDEQVSVDFE